MATEPFHVRLRSALAHRSVVRELRRLSLTEARGLQKLLKALNRAQQHANVKDIAALVEEIKRFRQATADASALAKDLYPRPASNLPSAPASAGVAPPIARPARSNGQDGAGVHRYVVSSATLAEAHAYLTQHLPGAHNEPEWMLAVSGVEVNGVRTLERLIEVRLASQSFGQASFDMEDFTRVAVLLHEHGLALHAILHSHRFGGPPSPSATDTRLQATLEEGGYPAIQAVFSEDGYVRFFANERRFVVHVYGKGVVPVHGSPALYRIVQFGTLPHPAAASAAPRRGAGLRSLPASAGR